MLEVLWREVLLWLVCSVLVVVNFNCEDFVSKRLGDSVGLELGAGLLAVELRGLLLVLPFPINPLPPNPYLLNPTPIPTLSCPNLSCVA